MATVYPSSTIKPTKSELLETVLGGPAEVLGSYRFDDPAGEVGVEGFIVRRDAALQHVVLAYRGAPLDGDEARLVSTMEHSELAALGLRRHHRPGRGRLLPPGARGRAAAVRRRDVGGRPAGRHPGAGLVD